MACETIWETLYAEGKITFSYQAFRGYVNRLIFSNKMEESAPSIEPSNTNKTHQKSTEEKNKVTTPEIQGFTFNPGLSFPIK